MSAAESIPAQVIPEVSVLEPFGEKQRSFSSCMIATKLNMRRVKPDTYCRQYI